MGTRIVSLGRRISALMDKKDAAQQPELREQLAQETPADAAGSAYHRSQGQRPRPRGTDLFLTRRVLNIKH
jgi:hypothetical protein